MVKVMNTINDEDHRHRLVENIRDAVDTLQHFKHRIKDTPYVKD